MLTSKSFQIGSTFVDTNTIISKSNSFLEWGIFVRNVLTGDLGSATQRFLITLKGTYQSLSEKTKSI